MKKLLVVLLMLVLTGCASSTEYGQCIGLDDKENPKLMYQISARNLVISIFFFETVIVPVVTLLTEIKCPTGTK